MFLSIDVLSLRRRFAFWGLAYAVAVVPCVITAGSGRGLLIVQMSGIALALSLVAAALSSRWRARWMKAAGVAVMLVVVAGLLSVVAWTTEETDGEPLWAWLTALALLGVSSAGLEATMWVMTGLRHRSSEADGTGGPAPAPWLTLRRFASCGALLCGLGLFALVMWNDYRNAASSVYWGARDAGLFGFSTLLWPDVPLLLAVTFMLGGIVGSLLGGLAWALVRGVARLAGVGVRAPGELPPPPA